MVSRSGIHSVNEGRRSSQTFKSPFLLSTTCMHRCYTFFFFYIDMVSSEKNLRQTLEFILYREFLFQMIVTHLWRIYQSILAFYTILLHPYNLNTLQNFRIGEEKQRNIYSVNNVNTEIICVYVSQLIRHANTFIKSRQATDK